jgi:cob(I)alamin adenosyltransferase
MKSCKWYYFLLTKTRLAATEPGSCPLQIQSLLLDIGANVATPRNAADADARLRMFIQQNQAPFAVVTSVLTAWLCAGRTEFSDVHVTTLEKWIDELDAELPPLKNFILPVRHAGYSCCRHSP